MRAKGDDAASLARLLRKDVFREEGQGWLYWDEARRQRWYAWQYRRVSSTWLPLGPVEAPEGYGNGAGAACPYCRNKTCYGMCRHR